MDTPELTVLQSPDTAQQRLVAQLRAKKVDSGQYYGGKETAEAWKVWSEHHPMKHLSSLPLDEAMQGDVCVVDLGPGTGKPCVAVMQKFRDRVREVIGVDVSPPMLHMAMEHIRGHIAAPVRGIVADFLHDAGALAAVLKTVPRQKVTLCLGGTAGNFPQRKALACLRSLLQDNDRLLLGLGLYEDAHVDQELQVLGDLFSSEANCRFGLRFLAACGGTSDHRLTFSRSEDDPEEEGVKVVRVFYRFPRDTVLTVGAEHVAFTKGEELQFVESRRYPKDRIEEYLRKHGLEVVNKLDLGKHGLFLSSCRGSSRTGGEARE